MDAKKVQTLKHRMGVLMYRTAQVFLYAPEKRCQFYVEAKRIESQLARLGYRYSRSAGSWNK